MLTVSPSGTGGVEALEEADVVVRDEHVDEAAESALVVEDPLGEPRVGGLEAREDLTDGGALDRDLGRAPGEGAEGGGHSDGDAHRGLLRGGGRNGHRRSVRERPAWSDPFPPSAPPTVLARRRTVVSPVEWRRAAAHLPDLPARRLRRRRPREAKARQATCSACACRRATRPPRWGRSSSRSAPPSSRAAGWWTRSS